MLNRILARIALWLLSLRYRIRVRGLGEVFARGRTGILFLPNHPALIDPVILTATLFARTPAPPRPLADRDQIDRFFIRWIARRMGARPIPEAAKGEAGSAEKIQAMLADTIEGLNRGENALLYPAGHLTHTGLEDLGGNSAAEQVLHGGPGVRVVLVRTRGLWGSSYSYADSRELNAGRILKKGALSLLANGVFFGPRRPVDIEFVEPADLPRAADRTTLNRYLEAFYNQDPSPKTYVPYTLWQRRGKGDILNFPARRASEKEDAEAHAGKLRMSPFSGSAGVPAATRQLVADHLRELSGREQVRDEDRLANDLGLDSLARTELAVWLDKEFGFPQGEPDALVTVGDVMLAACGEAISSGAGPEIKPPAKRWFLGGPPKRPYRLGVSATAPPSKQPLGGATHLGEAPHPLSLSQGERDRKEKVSIPDGDTITAVFLRQAARRPGQAAAADPTSGVKTYRDLVAAVMVLVPIVRRLAGDGGYVGIMLPASVAADVLYLAALFAGKTPVMVNWTVGSRNMLHSLDLLGVRRVFTAAALVSRLESEGTDLAGLKERFVLLERVGKSIPLASKLRAAIASRLTWRSLEKTAPPANAVVLFTSGSESLPKAVPLTHANLLANIRDAAAFIDIYQNDRLLGMLPPFHSMGLTATMLLPLCLGAKVVHYPNPTAGAALAGVIAAYRTTIAIGTPTFLGGIVRACEPGQLASLRAAVTGAEKCPPAVYAALADRCPQARVLEGYGITECSPVVCVNDYNAPRPGTIGKVLPSLSWAVLDVETGEPVPPGKSGMLLLRGPTVFGGYLNYSGPSPFVEHAGQSWYRTGDLVHCDADGVFTFDGRLKRFVKLGGEMISLPAIEEVLAERFAPEGGAPKLANSRELGGGTPAVAQDDSTGATPKQPYRLGVHEGQDAKPAADESAGPTLAVEATPTEEHPEIVLFTTLALTREEVNAHLRAAGLGPLHNIRRIVRLESIPVLGTGKTDYRALRERLAGEE